MRGYTFDRALAVERAKAMSTAFRESQAVGLIPVGPVIPAGGAGGAGGASKEKPAVLLHKDAVYVSPEPKVPVHVIWVAAGCVALGVVLWGVFAAIQCRRRVDYLERFVKMLAERQGIYVTRGL